MITIKARQLKSGKWKAIARFEGGEDDFLEFWRWGDTEEIATEKARSDLMAAIRITGGIDEPTDGKAA